VSFKQVYLKKGTKKTKRRLRTGREVCAGDERKTITLVKGTEKMQSGESLKRRALWDVQASANPYLREKLRSIFIPVGGGV